MEGRGVRRPRRRGGVHVDGVGHGGRRTGPRGIEGAEVDGRAADDCAADDHGDGTGELSAAALHTVLDGHAEVDEAEDDEHAAEEGDALSEHLYYIAEHCDCSFLVVEMGFLSESGESVKRGEPGDDAARRDQGDGLHQFAAPAPQPVLELDAEVDQADDQHGRADVGDGFRGDADDFFHVGMVLLSFRLGAVARDDSRCHGPLYQQNGIF